jgi:putative GTP pyrophosphokinase
MKTKTELEGFLREYENYTRDVLIPVHEELRSYLRHWRDFDYWAAHAGGATTPYPSPVRGVLTRIKRPERVVDKILQRPDEYPDGLSPASFRKMHDTIGIRIIVYFLSQLPYVDRELRDSEVVEISVAHPPEAFGDPEMLERLGLSHISTRAKESGYSSIHYVIRLKGSKVSETDCPWSEMQVRTLAQEFWSEMEHILAYKPQIRTDFSTKRRLKILSREIGAIDEHFNLLHEELVHKQELGEHDRNDVLSAENLPGTLSEIGVRCAQQDFNTILSLLHSRGIRKVEDLIRLATPKRLETIRNTYVSAIGRRPQGFELIASLGVLGDVPKGDDERQYIISQIEYRKVWDRFRKEEKVAASTEGKTL